MDAYRDYLLDEMMAEYLDTMPRLPEGDRPAFTTAYSGFITRMNNVIFEASLDILDGQYLDLVAQQTVDPLFDARRTAVVAIQTWLEAHYGIATDDSRIDMYAAQTAAYDAIDAATTVEAVDTARINGMSNLQAAFVEDSVRIALYGPVMNEAVQVLNDKLETILQYSDNIYLTNQAHLIIQNAKMAIWSSIAATGVTDILNTALSDIEAVGLTWDPAQVDELKADSLFFLNQYLTSWETVPSEVLDAYSASYPVISGASDPLTILDSLQGFIDICNLYL
jgi:hypothetical protein